MCSVVMFCNVLKGLNMVYRQLKTWSFNIARTCSNHDYQHQIETMNNITYVFSYFLNKKYTPRRDN